MCGIVLCQILWCLVGLGEIIVKGVEVVNVVWKDVCSGVKIVVILFIIIVVKYYIVLVVKQFISVIGKEIYGIYFVFVVVLVCIVDYGVVCVIRIYQCICFFID